jgi:ribosomal protein L7Ae-like RNA K-turn-binding protein
LSGVKAKKVRILFIAPNTEVSAELDERLLDLISQAQIKEIPVVYCLNKRQLGKAVQMTIKQSVIAVIDPDGAYDLFKKIIRYVSPS